MSTFNTTHKRGMQPQPELVSPISPNSPSVTESPDLAKQLVSRDSRPVSDLSEIQDTSTQEFSYEQPSSNDYSHGGSSHKPTSSGDFKRQGLEDENPPRYEASAENAPGRSEVVKSPDGQEKLPTSRLDRGQSPHSSVGHNRTPTQADYADYFRRGSSSSVQVPKASSVSPDSRAVDTGDPIEQSRFDQHPTVSQLENTLRSKFSTHDRQEIPLADRGEVTSEQNPSFTTQGPVSRQSGESRETFATAPSKAHRRPKESAAGAAHNTSDKVEDSSIAESTEDGSSSHGSTKAATPVAVPAANIQDRPGGRPFSFIKFSQNPTPAPLEDYSHRKPSVDSVPGQIDPEQDAPPSPMSSSQPVVPRQSSRATAKAPLYRDVRHDFPPDTSPRFSGSPSCSFSRPFQDTSLQGQPAARQEQSAPEQGDMPAQHYPAAIPRQEMVHPRQQATEYSLEGVGPPLVPRTPTNRSTSKRGSRSSAFFRSFKSPTESMAPALPSDGDDEKAADMSEEPRIRKSKSRRSSLFRSLTKGSKASSTDDASQRLPENPRGPSLQSSPRPPPPPPVPPPNTERETAPADLPNKHHNRLSKTTTGKDVEQKASQPAPPGKKKRFSGLGVCPAVTSFTVHLIDGMQSLFTRSKDPGRKSVQMDRPQQIPEQPKPQSTKQRQDDSSRISSTGRTNLEQAPSANSTFNRGGQNQYTRDSLAREGLLPQAQTSRHSSRSPEPSAYHQDSTDRQQTLPPRHQSLGHRNNQREQRPSQWLQQYPSSSSNTRQQTFPASQNQQRTTQSTVTTRSGNQPSGYSQRQSNPRHFSSTVTTTTTSGGRMPNTTTTTFQSSSKDVQPRSESPPPPPPPPKDAWRRPKPPQQRSSTSNTVAAPASGEPPTTAATRNPSLPTSGSWNAPSQPRTSFHSPGIEPENLRPDQHQAQQSLPPLETDVRETSNPVPQPRAMNSSAGSDPEARKLRRSQIESMGSPRAVEDVEPRRTEQASVGQQISELERKAPRGPESDDEPVVMSATSFPGQEWQPSGYRGWDEC